MSELQALADQLAGVAATIRQHAMLRDAVMEASEDGMVVIDRNGDIVLVNQMLEMLTGYARKDLLGKPLEILVPRDLRERHRGHRESYLIHPEPRAMATDLDLHLKTVMDELVPVMIRLYPVRSNGDRFIVAVVRKRAVV